MKYYICILLLFFLLSNKVFSQSFYIIGGMGLSGGLGYGLDDHIIFKYSNGVTKKVDDYLSQNPIYGFGIFGYCLSNKFNIEVGINSYGKNNSYSHDGLPFSYDSGSSKKVLRIMPAVKFKFTKTSHSFYLKGGASLGFGGNEYRAFKIYNDLPPWDSGGYKVRYSGGIAPGYMYAIGKDFSFHQDKYFHFFSFYVELVFITNSWTPAKETILESFGKINIPSLQFFYSTKAIQMGLKYSFD